MCLFLNVSGHCVLTCSLEFLLILNAWYCFPGCEKYKCMNVGIFMDESASIYNAGLVEEVVGGQCCDRDVHLLQDAGAGVYTVGINLRNTEELDGVSSQPLDWYQTLVNSEGELDPVPATYKYRMETGELMTVVFVYHCMCVCVVIWCLVSFVFVFSDKRSKNEWQAQTPNRKINLWNVWNSFCHIQQEKIMRCRNTECCSFIQMKFSHSRQIFNVVCFLSPFMLLIVCLFLFWFFFFFGGGGLFVLFCFCFVCLTILIAFFHHLCVCVCVCVCVCMCVFVLFRFFLGGGGGGGGGGRGWRGGLLGFVGWNVAQSSRWNFAIEGKSMSEVTFSHHSSCLFVLFCCWFWVFCLVSFFFFIQWCVYEHEVQTIKIFRSH